MSETQDRVLAQEGRSSAPLPRHIVAPIVEPHLARLSAVLTEAWADFVAARETPPGHLTRVRAASQGMVISDLLTVPVHKQFAGVPGVQVITRFDRPWVHLDGGRVQVRFRALTPTLGVCRGQSDRAVRLAHHLPDATLDLEVPADGTVLTAGYVLDPSRQRIDRLALVCLIGFSTVHYWFSLPGGAAAAAPTQLPMVPLSEPIIRSARAAAVKRLGERDGSA